MSDSAITEETALLQRVLTHEGEPMDCGVSPNDLFALVKSLHGSLEKLQQDYDILYEVSRTVARSEVPDYCGMLVLKIDKLRKVLEMKEPKI